MKTKTSAVLLFIALSAAFVSFSCTSENTGGPSPVPTQNPNYGSIYGNVSKQLCCDSANPYFAYTTGRVDLVQSAAVLTATATDSNGDYAFVNINPGTYDVALRAEPYIYGTEARLNNGTWESINSSSIEGYSYTYMTKTVVTVAGGETAAVDFRFWGY